MYWGEGHVKLAASADLRAWHPLGGPAGDPDARWAGGLLRPRPGRFDSELVEPGPPARVEGDHVTLVDNAKAADGTYAPGQVRSRPPERVRNTYGPGPLAPPREGEAHVRAGSARAPQRG